LRNDSELINPKSPESAPKNAKSNNLLKEYKNRNIR